MLELAVPEAKRAVATVPDDKLLAFKLVIVLLAPLMVLFVTVFVLSTVNKAEGRIMSESVVIYTSPVFVDG